MKNYLSVFGVLFFFLLQLPLHAQIGIAPEIVNQNNYLTREWLRIQIENKEGGSILISPDAGKTWESLGAVLKPATQTNPQGYTASRWAQISKVSDRKSTHV